MTLADTLPPNLPPNTIRHRWVRVSKFPDGKKIGRRSMVVDTCKTRDGKPHSIHVAYLEAAERADMNYRRWRNDAFDNRP